jgi:hypothetical protein
MPSSPIRTMPSIGSRAEWNAKQGGSSSHAQSQKVHSG